MSPDVTGLCDVLLKSAALPPSITTTLKSLRKKARQTRPGLLLAKN
jgi:hypothetical protein